MPSDRREGGGHLARVGNALRIVENDSAAIVIRQHKAPQKSASCSEARCSEVSGLAIVLHILAREMLASSVTGYGRL
jgi:hypothetical protein